MVVIVLIAIVFRLWGLGSIPPSPDWDEVSLGYNAYSIFNTGRDEYGKFLPVVLRSFDDYKPALYAYFIIPFIPLFDLSVLTVRLPGAIFGVFSVIIAYFLVKEIFKSTEGNKMVEALAIMSSFFLAISPWSIQFSRIAFESQVGMVLNILALLLFLKGLRNSPYLLISSFLMAINIYMYQSEKVYTPLLLFFLLLIYKKEIVQVPKKYLFLSTVIGLIVVLPMIFYILITKEALLRAQGVSIFADKTQLLEKNVNRLVRDKENNSAIGFILDNRRIEYAKQVTSGYVSHFDLNWLFINGDIARHHAPNMGLLYLWELPFLLIGIYSFSFGNYRSSSKLLILGLLLISPIPASITSGVPSAVRTLNFLPTFQILTALGVLIFYQCINRIRFFSLKIGILVGVFFIVVFNISYYIDQYFVQLNYYTSKDWQYGYQEAVQFVNENKTKYEKIIVSNRPHLDQSYMFFLFYLKYSPKLYQQEAKNNSGGFKENHSFGNFEFRPIEWEKEKKTGKRLFIGKPGDFGSDSNVLKKIYFKNGEEAINIAEG